MKIAVSVVGFFSLTLMIIGSLFKMQHWPGAGVMIVVGTSLFATVFCLLYFIYRVIERKGALDVIEGMFISWSLSVIAIGMMFKVQHWPGAGVMLTVGITVMAAVLIPLLLVKFIRTKEKLNGMLVLYAGICAAFLCMTFAINVSREVLWGYEVSNSAIERNNKALLASLEHQNENLETISELSMNAYNAIEQYKRHVIMKTERLDENTPADQYQVQYLLSRDNFDIPSHLLVGDPANPNDGEWSAVALKDLIMAYNIQLLSLMNTDEAKYQVEALLALESVRNNGYNEPWEVTTFYHQTLISVINSLNSLQNSILVAQSIAIQDAVTEVPVSVEEH